MKKVFQASKYFPIILFSFWFIISTAGLICSALDDLGIAPLYPCFKNIDQEDSMFYIEKKKKGVAVIDKGGGAVDLSENSWRIDRSSSST